MYHGWFVLVKVKFSTTFCSYWMMMSCHPVLYVWKCLWLPKSPSVPMSTAGLAFCTTCLSPRNAGPSAQYALIALRRKIWEGGWPVNSVWHLLQWSEPVVRRDRQNSYYRFDKSASSTLIRNMFCNSNNECGSTVIWAVEFKTGMCSTKFEDPSVGWLYLTLLCISLVWGPKRQLSSKWGIRSPSI